LKIVIQRVSQAGVTVEGRTVGTIGRGFLILLCVEKGDGPEEVRHYARKIAEVRIFPDDAGRMNRSIKEAGGEILLISQFTLAGNVEKGRRPSFESAAPPGQAEPLYDLLASTLQGQGIRVVSGVFRAYMQVSLVNDGPVTILMGK
jgi:D-tyrosyl-tRNA(Tyr) deacylase